MIWQSKLWVAKKIDDGWNTDSVQIKRIAWKSGTHYKAENFFKIGWYKNARKRIREDGIGDIYYIEINLHYGGEVPLDMKVGVRSAFI